jgi:hypothetical protein
MFIVSSSYILGFQACSYCSINFINSLLLFSSHYFSSTTAKYLLKFGHSFLMQGVGSIVEDLLSWLLKAESVRCKCIIKIKGQFLKNTWSYYSEKDGLIIRIKPNWHPEPWLLIRKQQKANKNRNKKHFETSNVGLHFNTIGAS